MVLHRVRGFVVLISCGAFLSACEKSATSAASVSIVEAGIAAPVAVPTRPFADTMHGVAIADPLRWMEDTTQAEVRAWLSAQSSYTEAIMGRLVGRDSLEAQVAGFMRDLPTLDAVYETPTRILLTRWFGENPSLLSLESGSTSERMLLSDSALASSRNGASLRALSPSWDGGLIAIGTTERGDLNTAISVIDATSGAMLPDYIPDLLTTTSGTRYEVTWLPDGSGFIYPRQWPGSATGASADRLARGRQFLHRLGTPQSADVPLFGFEVSASVAFDKEDLPTRVLTGPGTAWMVGSVFRSRQNATEYFAAEFSATGTMAWTRIATTDDLIQVPQLHGDTVYAISRRDADRGAIVRRVLGRDSANGGVWQPVVRERRGVLMGFSVQQDGLYFTERDGGAIALQHIAPGASTPTEITMPTVGTISLRRRAPSMRGAVVSVQSWATTPRWLRVDGQQVTALGINDQGAAAASATMVSDRLEAPSRDGELVPVSLVYDPATMSGRTLDGTAPLLIEAYGAFGTSSDPRFDPKALAWVSLGGVFAYAHVRGGGERGEAWHRAATRENKQRTIDDMIGAIETLIDKRYTSAGRVVVTGTSFGSVIPGMVALQRPELLGVALYEVGQPDEIRGAQQDPTAARNIAEIGDLDTDTGIRLLLKSSPYHQVPATLPLPAMLLHSASEDYNFGNEMLVGKYVARLQAANSGTRPIVWARTPGGHSDLFYVSPGWAATAMSFLLWQTGHPRFQPAPLPPK